MSRFVRYCLFCLVVLPVCVPVLAASSAPTSLAPEQLEIVRGVGRSVLASRHNIAEDPDVISMKETLHGLRDTVSSALSVSTPSIAITDKAATMTAERFTRPATDGDVRNRLSELKARRLQLQSRAAQGNDEQTRARLNSLAMVASSLETETGHVLALADGERIEQLAKLRERLEPQALDQRIRSGLTEGGHTLPLSTPTLITITEHR